MVAENEPASITKRQSIAVFSASAIGAATTLLTTIIVKRSLQGAELTEFLLFWSLLFALYTLPAGIYIEATRAVGAYYAKPAKTNPRNAVVLLVALSFGAIIAILIGSSAVFWGASQLPTHTVLTVTVICISVLLYSVQTTMYGASAGRGKWYQYAALSSAEPLLRLILIIFVAFSATSLLNMELAAALPVSIWIVFIIFWKDARRSLIARADTNAKQLSKNVVITTLTAVFSAALIMGLPNILKASEGHIADHVQITKLAVLILAIIICRAPIMFPLGAIQSIAVKAFLAQKNRLVNALCKPVLMLGGIGLLGSTGAWFIGPFLFKMIYPPRPDELQAYEDIANGQVLATLVFAGVLIALLTITGTAALAVKQHLVYLLGWAIATIVAFVIIMLPLELLSRTILALYLGPIVGTVSHVTLLKLRENKSKIN